MSVVSRAQTHHLPLDAPDSGCEFFSAAGAGDGAGAGRQLALVPSSLITRIENDGTDDDGDDDSDDKDGLLLSSLVSQSGHLLAE